VLFMVRTGLRNMVLCVALPTGLVLAGWGVFGCPHEGHQVMVACPLGSKTMNIKGLSWY
jgi:hypothetical protein